MLVREKHDDKALTYIDQLSYTFRYIIQNGQSTLMTLDEELKFIEAYSYLFEIRYADKLFFDIDVDDKYRSWTLPALSLQPLIGNAVKPAASRSISRSAPSRGGWWSPIPRCRRSNPNRRRASAWKTCATAGT